MTTHSPKLEAQYRQPLSLEPSINFTTCCEQFHDVVPIVTTSQNQSHELYYLISQRMIPIFQLTSLISRSNIPNTLHTLLTRSKLSPQLNPQPYYTLQSIRLRTPTTLGLCCLLQCIVIKEQRSTSTTCFSLRGNVLKDQRKIHVKARGLHVNTKQRETNKQQEGKGCEMRWEVVNMTTT